MNGIVTIYGDSKLVINQLSFAFDKFIPPVKQPPKTPLAKRGGRLKASPCHFFYLRRRRRAEICLSRNDTTPDAGVRYQILANRSHSDCPPLAQHVIANNPFEKIL